MAELKQLRALRAVAGAGSFSAAADELDYTQPAVSRIVAALERELGAPLVDRATRPLRLTDAGVALMRHADQIFEHLAGAEAEIQAIAQLDAGTLRVGTFSSAGAAFVVDAVAALRAAHPGIDITVVEGWPSALVASLRGGDLDVSVVFDFPEAGEHIGDGLDLEHLLDDPLLLVIPANHRLAARKRLSFADLANEDWLLPAFGPDSPSLRLINRGCTAAGFEPRIVCRINDCQMTQAMIAIGVGISMLPRLMLEPVRDGVAIKPLTAGAPIRRISAARLTAKYRTPTSDRFLTALQDAADHHSRLRETPGN